MDWNRILSAIVGVGLEYLIFSTLAWLVIWTFELAYNGFAVGIVLLYLYYLWMLIKPKSYIVKWRGRTW